MAYAYIRMIDENGDFILDGQGNRIIVDRLSIPDEIFSFFNTGDASPEEVLQYQRGRSIAATIQRSPRSVMTWRIKQVNNDYMTIFNERQLGGIWKSPWGALGQIVGTQTRYGAQTPVLFNEVTGEAQLNQLSIVFDDDDFTITGKVSDVDIAAFGWTNAPRMNLESRAPKGAWGTVPGTFRVLVDGEDAIATIPAAYETEYRAVIKEVPGAGNANIYSSIIDLPTSGEFVFIPDKRPMAASLTKISTSASNYYKRGWGKAAWSGPTDLATRTGLVDMCDTQCVPLYDEGMRRFWFWNPAGFANVSALGNYPDYKWYTSNSWTGMADDADPSDFDANLDGSVKMPAYDNLNIGRQEAWSVALNDFASGRSGIELGIYGGYDVPYLDGELDYDTVTMDGSGTQVFRYELPDPSNPEHVAYWRTQTNGWLDNTPVTAIGFDTGSSVYDDDNQQFFNLLGVKPLFEAVPLIFISSNNYVAHNDERYAKAAYWAIYNGWDQPSATGGNKGYWEGRSWRAHNWVLYEQTYGGTEMHFAIAYYTARFNNKASASDMQQAATDAHALGYVVGITGSSAIGNSVSAQQYVDLGYGTLAEGQALTGPERGAIYDQEVQDFAAFLVSLAS